MSTSLFKCKPKQCLHFGFGAGVKTMSTFLGSYANQTAICLPYLTVLQTKHLSIILFLWTSVSTFLWLSSCKPNGCLLYVAPMLQTKRLSNLFKISWKPNLVYIFMALCKLNVCRPFLYLVQAKNMSTVFWFSSCKPNVWRTFFVSRACDACVYHSKFQATQNNFNVSI